MKRRLLALALCLCVALAWVPVTARAEVSTSDARVYLDILNAGNYGNSYLLDFDGDGRDELLTTAFSDNQYEDSVFLNLWTGDKAILENYEYYDLAAPTLDIYKRGDHLYLCETEAITESVTDFYSTIQNGAWTRVQILSSFSEFDGYNVQDIYQIDRNPTTQAEYDAQKSAYQYQFSICPWNNPTPGDVRPQLQEILYRDMTAEELLAEMAYAGDASKCRMTAEQAEAYANALEDTLRAEQSRDQGYGIDSQAALFDTGTGVPALLLATLPAQAAGSYETRTFIWEYVNGAAVPFEHTNRWIYIYPHHMVCATGMGYAEAYEFQNGRINQTPTTVTEMGHYIDGKEVPDEAIDAWDDRWLGDGSLCEESMYGGGNKCMQDTSTLLALLRAYSKANLAPVYPLFTDILNSGWEAEPVAAALGAVPGEAAACYSLTDGMCYVIVKTPAGYQGVLVQAHLQWGRVSWQVLRTDVEPATQEALSAAVNEFLSKPNLILDFNILRENKTARELADYLRSLFADVTGKGPNDMAKRDLAAFVSSALSSVSTATVSGRKNRLALDGDVLAQLSRDAGNALAELSGVLEENGVVLNQTITPVVRAVWSDVDLSEPCQIDLDRALARALDGCDLQVLLGDAGTYLGLSADNLADLTRELDGLQVQFSREGNNVYALRFLDGDGEVVERLNYPVTVSLPATGPLNTVMVSYAGGTDNWGGQYDPAAGAISFEARYSGTYQVLENSVAIDDIAGLGEESRAAIAFMVSKGYLSAENGLFRPGDSLTRYEFTQALVGMFFALDRDQACDFPDVDPASPYYPYVASAQAKSIVNGYDDGTFSGDDPINREQVFALAARTLMDQKGYAAPEDFEQYLSSFTDRAQISGWAAPQVALSVREGIAGRGEILLPQENITREQAAVVLYRLFCLLYEVSPVALDVPGGGGSALPIILGVSIAAVLAAGGVTTGVILHKKRKKKVKNQTPVG